VELFFAILTELKPSIFSFIYLYILDEKLIIVLIKNKNVNELFYQSLIFSGNHSHFDGRCEKKTLTKF
jgi:hypothetical protein